MATLARLHAAAAAPVPPELTPEIWQRSGLVHTLTQDARGFVWVGTPLGLRRFDGVKFVDVALGDNVVPRVVAAASNGGLWVATGDGMLGVTEGGVRQLGRKVGTSQLLHVTPSGFVPAQGLAQSWILALVADAEGGVWVGMEAGLAHVTPQGMVNAFTPHQAVGALAFVGDALYAGCGDGLWRVDRQARFANQPLSNDAVFSLSSAPKTCKPPTARHW
ncbi:MAG: hypothetical protein SF187_20280 [Deltaproteobacteria bacterium]|nr:hypothetical protein [Deltaproteobacteria bacterium]